jgi:hypothetical protein
MAGRQRWHAVILTGAVRSTDSGPLRLTTSCEHLRERPVNPIFKDAVRREIMFRGPVWARGPGSMSPFEPLGPDGEPVAITVEYLDAIALLVDEDGHTQRGRSSFPPPRPPDPPV